MLTLLGSLGVVSTLTAGLILASNGEDELEEMKDNEMEDPFLQVDDEDVDLVPRHPAQLYESLAYALVFLMLLFVYRKKKSVVACVASIFKGKDDHGNTADAAICAHCRPLSRSVSAKPATG